MKDFLLSLFTIPGVLILIYFLGLASARYKTKLRFFSVALFFMFIMSIPVVAKLFSYPLIKLPKYFTNKNINQIDSVVILTGGIYKNAWGKWVPSYNTEQRVFLAQKFLKLKNVPLIISGGSTKLNAPSEAEVTKEFYGFEDAIIETAGLNTYQSAVNLKNYCINQNNSLMIITDAIHSLRSYLTFKSQACKTIIYNHENYNLFEDIYPSLKGFAIFNKAMYEYIGILYYIITLKINIIKFI